MPSVAGAGIAWSIKADFARSGTFATDLTPDVNALAGGSFSCTRGIDDNGVYQVSALQIVLNNRSGKYTPGNSASAIYGLVSPHVPVQITLTFLTVAYTIWTGYIKEWSINFEGRPKLSTITLGCQDLAGYLSTFQPVNIIVSNTRLSSDAVIAAFAAMGLAAGNYTVDTGIQAFPYHWARNQTALAVVMDAVRSELGGFVWTTAQGKMRFESRHSRLGVSVVDTWGDGTSVTPRGINLKLSPTDVITTATVRANVFSANSTAVEIFRFERGAKTADSLAIAAGQTYTASFNYGAGVQPATLVAPAANVDYTGNSNITGTATDKTSALTPVVTDRGAGFDLAITNSDASTVYVTLFKMRGAPVQWGATRPQFVATKTVPWTLVGKSATIDVPWTDDTAMLPRDYAYQILRTYRYPYPTVTVDFDVHRNNATAIAAFSAELGQRIQLTDTARGVAAGASMLKDVFYIEGVQHDFGVNRVGKTLVKLIPSYTYRNVDKIAYDDYNRANATGALGTSLQGKVWATATGWDINSLKARANSASPAPATLNLGAGATDHVAEISLSSIPGGVTTDEAGVVYRYQDASNFYKAYVSKATSQLRLDKVVAGAVTNLATFAWTPKTTSELRAMVQGSRHRIDLDYLLAIDITDASLTTGVTVGLYGKNSSGATKYADFYGQSLI